MAKQPSAEMIAEGLSVPARVMLFCIADATDWQKAGVKTTGSATPDYPRPDQARRRSEPLHLDRELLKQAHHGRRLAVAAAGCPGSALGQLGKTRTPELSSA